jgi:ABC-type multidrug transport system permease subunit
MADIGWIMLGVFIGVAAVFGFIAWWVHKQRPWDI